MRNSTFTMQINLSGYEPGIEGRVVEQRKAERFELQLPVLVVREGNQQVCMVGETRNLSSGGVLIAMQAPISIGESIEYVIMLALSSDGRQSTRLHCKGNVLRNEGLFYAITIERHEFLRDDLPAKMI